MFKEYKMYADEFKIVKFVPFKLSIIMLMRVLIVKDDLFKYETLTDSNKSICILMLSNVIWFARALVVLKFGLLLFNTFK